MNGNITDGRRQKTFPTCARLASANRTGIQELAGAALIDQHSALVDVSSPPISKH